MRAGVDGPRGTEAGGEARGAGRAGKSSKENTAGPGHGDAAQTDWTVGGGADLKGRREL